MNQAVARRHFPGLIFLGAPDSAALCELLHRRLDDALDSSGGLQQSSQGEPEDELTRDRLHTELTEAVADIVAALTGRSMTLGERLPYPYDCAPLQDYAQARGQT
jgi:hypothetical protein